jgi:hypothetical protein
MDPGKVGRWRIRQIMERPGSDSQRLRALVGELNRRLAVLDKQVEWVNGLDPDVQGGTGVLKAALVHAAILEQELLRLPKRIFPYPPSPMTLIESILLAHDSAQGGNDDVMDSPSPPPGRKPAGGRPGKGEDDDVQDDKTRHVRRDRRSKS